MFSSPGESLQDIKKTIKLSVDSIIQLAKNFEKLGTHSLKDFKLVINIPEEFKDCTHLFQSSLSRLEKRGLNYLLLASDDPGTF